jgi:hypothetical protein
MCFLMGIINMAMASTLLFAAQPVPWYLTTTMLFCAWSSGFSIAVHISVAVWGRKDAESKS